MQIDSIRIGEDNIQALENFSYFYPGDECLKQNGPDFQRTLYKEPKEYIPVEIGKVRSRSDEFQGD